MSDGTTHVVLPESFLFQGFSNLLSDPDSEVGSSNDESSLNNCDVNRQSMAHEDILALSFLSSSR